jgi:cytochrome c peroxidase
MKKLFLLVFLLFISILLVINCKPSSQNTPGPVSQAPSGSGEAAILVKQVSAIFGTIPEKMPGADKDTEELVRLGEKLYFDKRLSDKDSQSCNTCHMVDNKKGGVDNLPTSPGAHGKNGKRNSPTVLNAGFQFVQFWDGRAATLEEQAKGPMLNPVEMAMTDDKKLVKKVSKIAEYKDLFKKAFPSDKKPFTFDHITMAIAAFERTLKTSDRFDEFMKGKYNALSADEQKGANMFITTGCITCHAGPLLGGSMYQKIGVFKPYKNTKDLGRYEVTKEEADKFIFKVPMLRNIAITAPYYHDGQIKTMEEAVKDMGSLQLGKDMTDGDITSIVAFFKSLTDKSRI